MEKITKVWFEGGRICIATDDGKTYGRPLEYFPILKEATDEQREAWKINKFGDAIRWEEIDEDIHLSSFYDTEEPAANNVIGDETVAIEAVYDEDGNEDKEAAEWLEKQLN